ncbi:MAG: hypothetical protein V3W44_03955 [Dehalococcoidales bacterium]
MKKQTRSGRSMLVALLSAALGATVGTTYATYATDNASGFWPHLVLHGANELEGYDSIKEMSNASDLVVVAQMSDFRFSRIIQGDAPEDAVTLAVADFAVLDDMWDDAPKEVSVEFLMPHSAPAAALSAIDARASSVSDEEVLLFLRSKKNVPSTHRLVNMSGMWTAAGGALRAPLSLGHGDTGHHHHEGPQAPGSSEGAGDPGAHERFAGEIAGMASVRDLMDSLTTG